MYDLDEIRERIDLAALIEETVTLKRSGASFQGMCPFHDNNRTPALAVFPATRTWKCFGCGEGGDAFAWWMKRENVEFREAVRALAERVGQPPPPAPPPFYQERKTGEGGKTLAPSPSPEGKGKKRPVTPLAVGPGEVWQGRAEAFVAYAEERLAGAEGEKARQYLEMERGLWPETWKAFRLGYNPAAIYDQPAAWGMEDDRKVWLPRGMVIPGFGRTGSLWYVKIRRPLRGSSLAQFIGELRREEWVTGNPADEPKFAGPRGGKGTLFTQFAARQYQLPAMLLTEGEWDAMIGWQYGRDLCDVATLGGATSRMDCRGLAYLARYAAVGVVMDSDQAGQQNVQDYWAKLQAVSPRLKVLDPPDHDLTDYWKHGGDLRGWLAGAAVGLMALAIEGMERAPERWIRLWEWAQNEGGRRKDEGGKTEDGR